MTSFFPNEHSEIFAGSADPSVTSKHSNSGEEYAYLIPLLDQ